MASDDREYLVALTANIVSAHVEHNLVAVGDLPSLIAKVHAALAGLGVPAEAPAVEQQPAVSIRSSIKPDYIVCLEDGKKLKMLKRHLRTTYNLSPAEYRAKWKLPDDYPMVAPNYAEQRRGLAHKIGLGRKPAPAATAEPEPQPVPEPTVSAPKKRAVRKLKLS